MPRRITLRTASRRPGQRQKATATEGLELLKLFWPSLAEGGIKLIDQSGYFINYTSSAVASLERQLKLPQNALLAAVNAMVSGLKEPRVNVATTIQRQFVCPMTGDAPGRAFCALSRIWTMLYIQMDKPKYQPPGSLFWFENEPITSATKRYFDQKAEVERAPDLPLRLDPDLTVVRLVRDHRIRILWTDNLAEHLSVGQGEKYRVLKIFRHKIWVDKHLEFPETSPIPRDVLEELMATFNLLLPGHKAKTKALMKKEDMTNTFVKLGTCGITPSEQWSDYKYWHTELQALTVILNEPPRGIQQLWSAGTRKKNLMNVVLFWVAGVMVAILTIVSSVCGIWSLQLAAESKDIGFKQLQLAIAQACADEELASKLPQWCPLPA
ncbi:hypothetical protein OQA88_8616 [Cercophora sp. LCS_1]